MAKKVLQIVETAYRATLEEQDDPVLWLTASLKGNGVEVDVLLRGNAVNYAVRGQDASGLTFGDKVQKQPPRIDEDVQRLIGKTVRVYFVEDDARARGIARGEIVAGVQAIAAQALPELLEAYEQVWHW
jgi:hypothetical protein